MNKHHKAIIESAIEGFERIATHTGEQETRDIADEFAMLLRAELFADAMRRENETPGT